MLSMLGNLACPNQLVDSSKDDSTKPPLKSSKNDDVNYTPLPTPNDNGEKTIKGSFGYTKYVYHGKQSEGNRFIKNDDL